MRSLKVHVLSRAKTTLFDGLAKYSLDNKKIYISSSGNAVLIVQNNRDEEFKVFVNRNCVCFPFTIEYGMVVSVQNLDTLDVDIYLGWE